METFRFAFDQLARIVLAPFGVTPATAWVRLDDDTFSVRFGPWRLATPRTNVACPHVTGPYLWIKAIGPRLSLADRGVTFGTNARAGVCVRFHEPVPGLAPGAWLRHPAATVTVTDPAALAARLAQ